jgi:hypothetical protein
MKVTPLLVLFASCQTVSSRPRKRASSVDALVRNGTNLVNLGRQPDSRAALSPGFELVFRHGIGIELPWQPWTPLQKRAGHLCGLVLIPPPGAKHTLACYARLVATLIAMTTRPPIRPSPIARASSMTCRVVVSQSRPRCFWATACSRSTRAAQRRLSWCGCRG